MKRSKRSSLTWAVGACLGIAAACGYEPTFFQDYLAVAPVPPSKAVALTQLRAMVSPAFDQDFEALVAFDDFPQRADNADCHRMDTEITAYREGLRLNPGWHLVITTQEWQNLQSAYDVYRKDKCPPITQGTSQLAPPCSTVAEHVLSYWTDVTTLGQWDIALKNENLRGLLQMWRRARAHQCISAP